MAYGPRGSKLRASGERGREGKLTKEVYCGAERMKAARRSARQAVMAVALGFVVAWRFGDCCLERDKESGAVWAQLLRGGSNLGRKAREEA